MLEEEQDNIELRSEEFQDILGDVSPWIIRWGIIVLAIIIAISIVIFSFYKYPVTVSVEGVLSAPKIK